MGSVNTSYKPALENYKGKILGFNRHGFAVYPNQSGMCAMDSCECCGDIIHNHLTEADFCPTCSIYLGIVTENLAREICTEQSVKRFDTIDKDEQSRAYYRGLTTGFVNGIEYGVKNSRPQMDYGKLI